MKSKKIFIVWGTEANMIPAIPNVLHTTLDEREAYKVMQEAIFAGYTNVSVCGPKNKKLVAV